MMLFRYLADDSGTELGGNALEKHSLDLGVNVDDLGVSTADAALPHVALGAGHEGSELHLVVGGTHLAHDLKRKKQTKIKTGIENFVGKAFFWPRMLETLNEQPVLRK